MDENMNFEELQFSPATLNSISIALGKLLDTNETSNDFHKKLLTRIQNLRNLTNSADAQIHYIDEDNKRIMSNLDSVYVTSDEDQASTRQPKIEKEHICEAVAKLKEAVFVNNIADLAEKFPNGVQLSNVYASSLMCVPICSTIEDRCFLVFELYRENRKPYIQSDIGLVMCAAKWISMSVMQNETKTRNDRSYNLNIELRSYVESYFIGNMEYVEFLTKILSYTKNILRVERVVFYKTDVRPNAYTLQADLYEESEVNNVFTMKKSPIKTKFQREKGIAGQVAKTGKLVNIVITNENVNMINSELYKNLLVKGILCMPVKYTDSVIGIIQLINKRDSNGTFSKSDEVVMERICIYLSLVQHYEKLRDLCAFENAKCEILKDVFSYQISTLLTVPSYAELDEVDLPRGFFDLAWYPERDDEDLIPLTFYMFKDMVGGMIDNNDALYEFLINVKKCHRDVPFRNFLHAFDSVHTMYCMMRQIKEDLSTFEMLGLMLASLCHSINSEGYSNDYYVLIKHPVTQVYDEPHMNNFQASFGKQLITYSQVLDKIDEDDRSKIWRIFTDSIINRSSTYGHGLRTKLMKIIDKKKYDPNNIQHRVFSLNLIMLCSCKSRFAKPFRIAKRMCENIYREFFHQGDQEKSLKKTPCFWMDRSNVQSIPENELDYIKKTCLPYFNMLGKLYPSLGEYYNIGTELAKAWELMIELRHKKAWNPDESIGKSFEDSTK